MLTLCMIVKDEEANIERAIRSAAPFIQRVAIVDTGSTDRTALIVTDLCAEFGLKFLYESHEQAGPFDFGKARTQALAVARKVSGGLGYSLMMDADDVVVEVDRKALHINVGYQVTKLLNGTSYQVTGIFDNGVDWTYKGVTHEFPDATNIPGHVGPVVATIIAGTHGTRSKDPLKYLHDAEAINRALMVETDQFMRNRYCFYLAQSYRDALHAGAAIYWYKVVVEAGNWVEEKYIAALNLGRLTGEPEWFRHATLFNRNRAEAYRALGLNEEADACKIQPGWLFVETSAYKSE